MHVMHAGDFGKPEISTSETVVNSNTVYLFTLGKDFALALADC